jgi:hypothetical protein
MGARRPRQVVLDTGALVGIERGDEKMTALLAASLHAPIRFLVPAGVLAQAWRDGSRQTRLARFLRTPEVEVLPLTEAHARERRRKGARERRAGPGAVLAGAPLTLHSRPDRGAAVLVRPLGRAERVSRRRVRCWARLELWRARGDHRPDDPRRPDPGPTALRPRPDSPVARRSGREARGPHPAAPGLRQAVLHVPGRECGGARNERRPRRCLVCRR